MPKRPGPAYRVFVSHATVDKWIAKTICEKIEAIPGVVTFRDDRDIAGGDMIAAALQRELKLADELLFLLTATSVTRQWVMLEVGAAWILGKRIVPICYNAAVDQVPVLSMNRAYLLNDFDGYLADLRTRVAGRRP